MDDGERQYEWEAGRRLKKLIVKGDPAEGIEDGFDEGSATTLKLEFSNGNLLANGVADTVITAKVYRKGEEVTDEYVATAFNWTRISGDESADASWNAAHSGMKSITVSANELTDDIQIQCTLTGTSPAYGSVDVNDSFIASHTRGVADSNDTLSIEDGTLFVTTDDDNYRLSGNELTALYPRLNGSVSANAWVYHSQPTKTIEFKYNSSGLRVQKKVTANGKTEVTDYTLHGKLVTHMTVGNDNLHFFYDAQSRPAKVNFNGVTYIYLHNLQGDVVGIIDKSGDLVVEYKYDAWGRLISITGSLAATLGIRNPFRYREYIYDTEFGLYYLRSRYYEPRIGRFCNADAWLGKKCVLFAHSLYTYCLNRVTAFADTAGTECERCAGGAGSDYWIYSLNSEEMQSFSKWLLLEYVPESIEQPLESIEKAMVEDAGNAIGEEMAGDMYSLGGGIVNYSKKYKEYAKNSETWFAMSYGLIADAYNAQSAEIICFFGVGETYIGMQFYDAHHKLLAMSVSQVSTKALRNIYSELDARYPHRHGHPMLGETLYDLYARKARRKAGGGVRLATHSYLY